MKIRAFIVDDEPLARQRVRQLLEELLEIEIIGEAGDGGAAVAAISQLAPDLVFLDVQMPGLDGFGVLQQLASDRLPAVIFTTAYDQHAIKAFEAHALDYLLKPLMPERFRNAVSRACETLANRQAGAATRGLLEMLKLQSPAAAHLTRLAVKEDEKTLFLKTADIECIEAAGKYVAVHAGKKTFILRQALGALEAELDPAKFLRASRAALVNLDRIKELQSIGPGGHVIVMESGRQVPTTRPLKEIEQAMQFPAGS